MELHIGKEIEKRYQESGLKLSEFAKRLNTSTRNVYSIFSRKDISADHLRLISRVLDFNFFTLYEVDLLRSGVAEPLPTYALPKKKISVTVELDGTSETMDYWFDTIKKINKAI